MNTTLDEFYAWYDSLSAEEQDKVDDLADEMGLPLYDDCSEVELSQLADLFNSQNLSDTYVVKIWHEVDPGRDAFGPQTAEEIFEVVARSPQEAKEYAKMQWQGPIDRIEIVDINPEYEDDYIPFDSCDSITGSELKPKKGSRQVGPTEKLHKLVDYLSEEGVNEHIMLEFFFDNLQSDDCYKMMQQLADECDIDLEDFYTYVLKE